MRLLRSYNKDLQTKPLFLEAMLTIDDITYTYDAGTAMAVNAIDHITTEIPDGQFIGLIGHTGSGKSTFVQMLNGLLRASSGRILFDGQDIDADGFDRKNLRSSVGLVFQYPEHQLFETDVITDVMFGPKNLGLSEEECRKRAASALRAVGMPEELYTQSPFDLSGGQKRRAAIAGVLAMHPRMLILDEPTAGLDPMGRDDILNMIDEMNRKMDMTILLVSQHGGCGQVCRPDHGHGSGTDLHGRDAEGNLQESERAGRDRSVGTSDYLYYELSSREWN